MLFGQLFPTTVLPIPQPGFPSLRFNFDSLFILVNGLAASPLGNQVIGPNGGSSTYYRVPNIFPTGVSVMLQGVVIDPLAANTVFAATDAHELRF